MDKVIEAQIKILPLENFLRINFPECVLMPTRGNLQSNIAPELSKQPGYGHKMFSTQELWDKWVDHREKGLFTKGVLMVLQKDMIVIDIDDHALAFEMENDFPEFKQTSIQETQKGRHYFFKRTPNCDKNAIYDKSRGIIKNGVTLPIDIKTVCQNGTGGVISVYPSPNKKWINPIEEYGVHDLPDNFLQFILSSKKQKNNKNNKNEQQINKQTRKNNMVENLINILNTERASNYDDWIRVGWCLHNINKDENLYLWINFSKKCPQKFKPGECELIWSKYMRNEGLNIGSLHLWAKKDNPSEYNKLCNDQLYSDIKNCQITHVAIAEIASKILKNKYVSASGCGKIWFYFNGSLWKQDPKNTYVRNELHTSVKEQFCIAISKVQLEQSEEDDDEEGTKAKQLQKIYSCLKSITCKLQDCIWRDRILRELHGFLFDETFLDKLDNKIDLIAFNNGVWDLTAKAFRPALPEDYVSLSVGYDFIPETNFEKLDIVKKYWELMHPVKEQREYCIKTFARQLFGDSGNEHFHIHAGHQGTASNGKTKFFEILEASLGNYVESFAVEFLTASKRPEPGKPMPNYDTWKGRRILYCTEPNYTEILNSGVMKAFTGAEKISYRLLYVNQITSFRPQFKMHIMTNDAPKCDGSDEGIKRRIRKIDYMTRFVEPHDVHEDKFMFAKDENLIYDLIHDHGLKMEFIRLLLLTYDHDFRFDPPEIVKINSSAYLDENNSIAKFVREYLEYGEQNDFVTLKEIRDIYKATDYCDQTRLNNLKRELEKQLKQPCLEQKRLNGKKEKNVFIGVKFVNETDQFADDCE